LQVEQHNVLLELIKPGRPMQNRFIERFNLSCREAVLDMFVFQSFGRSASIKRKTPKLSMGVFSPTLSPTSQRSDLANVWQESGKHFTTLVPA
jgi:hypothetical protein